MDFAAETGFRLLLNLRGAGASIPDHLHWQGLRIDFPAFREEYAGEPILRNAGLEVRFLGEPWSGIRLCPRTAAARRRVARAVSCWGEPFNLVVADSTVCLFPRTRDFPTCSPEFKFGAAEVAGVVYAKTRAMLEAYEEPFLICAVKEVGMAAEERGIHAARLVELLS
jgi:hypothetical protein